MKSSSLQFNAVRRFLNTNINIPRQIYTVVGFSALSFVIGCLLAWYAISKSRLNVLAMQRGRITDVRSSNSMPATASVELVRTSTGYMAELRFEAMTKYGQGLQTRELGPVASRSEAIEKWASLEWREDGLYVGSGTNKYFMPKGEMEKWSR